ncbi:hypothetical protein [Pararhodospirillum oryzae]|uniref:DUF1828 domain-containing protein n=1 Tax=Pararhodospirillum oryzae TaxID=478448 RepID=A0A512H6Z9_9PROT|nr:hypothetical protein [Pararhodospirillum oryzae]GEO81214.1 hypothetical protein ROR02_13450 [Pararhodospirillum oryzae]
MASIGPISLFREKTTVHQIGGGRPGPIEEGALVIRSNRIILELTTSVRKEQVVVRGQTVPSTLRVAALVVERFLRDPQIFHRDDPVDWEDLWVRKRSDYDRRFSPESWVSIHVDGRTLFATNGSDAINLIEQVAHGEDLTDEIIRDATRALFSSAQDVVVQHESQTAVVFTPFATHLRAAVLERRGGRTGSFSASAFHGPEGKVRLGAFVNFVADLVEAVTLREFLERIRVQMEQSGQSSPPIPHDHLSAALGRKRQCAQFVAAFENAFKVQYRPERPEF